MLSRAFLYHTRMEPEMVKGPLDCVSSDSCTSLSVLGLNPRTSFIKVKSHSVVCLGCGIFHTHFCCPMQTKSSFQTFIRSKQAIWLLTTNESLLVTSSFLYVWYKGLGPASSVCAVCQDLTTAHSYSMPEICPRPKLSRRACLRHVQQKVEKEKQRGIICGC